MSDDLDMLLGERAYQLPEIVAATLARIAQEARQVAGGRSPSSS